MVAKTIAYEVQLPSIRLSAPTVRSRNPSFLGCPLRIRSYLPLSGSTTPSMSKTWLWPPEIAAEKAQTIVYALRTGANKPEQTGLRSLRKSPRYSREEPNRST